MSISNNGDRASTTAGFVSLGNGIYIKKMGESADLSVKTDPSLILIFGWMGAAMPHLMKYTTVYSEMYPLSTQILIQSKPSSFLSPESIRRANLKPVIEILEAMGCIGSAKSTQGDSYDAPIRILTHCFSNGGAFELTTLHRLIISRNLALRRPAISALVLDSNPGYGTLEESQNAMLSIVRNPIAYFCVYVFLIAYYCAAWLRGNLADGKAKFVLEIREGLNDANLLGWMTKKTPRLYLYSEKDQLIPAKSVEEHAKQAEASGFDLVLEKFPDTKHVSHARSYPDRYWGSIKQVWNEANKQ